MPKQPRPQRFLKSDINERQRGALESRLREAITAWDAEGFAFIGRPPRMRIAVLVRKKLASPARPATSITLPRSLGGRELKVAVRALHREAEVAPTSGASAMPAGGGRTYLAPGVPVLCDGTRVGIGCVVAIRGKAHLVTCGHAVSDSSSELTTLDGQTTIGNLNADFFHARERLDAAIYATTASGRTLLSRGLAAPTWFDDVHVPSSDDNDRSAIFWPTRNGNTESFVEDVESYSACVPTGAGCNYVMLTRCTGPGDSGSLLQFDNQYYAIASLRDGNNSFFTPLSAVIRRLETNGASVTPWRPQ